MEQGHIDGAVLRARRTERGFTLLEMMMVVAVIAILALVVIPTFFKSSRKSKSTSEVSAMFAEFSVREEQYKVDNGVYFASAACPATSSAQGNAASGCISSGSPWETLRIAPPEAKLFCSYEVTIGNATGTNNPSGFTFTSPGFNWWYVIATCDMDDDTTKDATYFTSSMDSTIQKLNEGF